MISETTQNDPNGLNGGVTYAWDEVGNRTSRTSTLPPAAGVTNQAFAGLYDTADRFINHTFDDNGSTLGADGRTYTYDSRRRLTRVQGTGLDVSYSYDSDGNLLQKLDAIAGVTTKYVFDTQNATGYSQTLEEIVNGTPKVRYTYGNRLISRAEWNGSQWQRRFYQFDGEGNVAFLTDETGTITDRYTYADGRVIRHDGPSTNEFLMKGERVDPATGLVFLRARWMDPNYERFMVRDSLEGSQFEPLSRHNYLYAEGNAINNSDPSGKSTLETKTAESGRKLVSNLKVRTDVDSLLISDMGEKFIKHQEAIGGIPRLKIYLDSKGKKTIGYGHRLVSGEENEFKDGITPEKAQELFDDDDGVLENEFTKLVSGASFYQHEYDALISFVFNVGLNGEHRGWWIWDKLQDEDNFSSVPRWLRNNYSRDNADRRKDEANLFQTGAYQYKGQAL